MSERVCAEVQAQLPAYVNGSLSRVRRRTKRESALLSLIASKWSESRLPGIPRFRSLRSRRVVLALIIVLRPWKKSVAHDPATNYSS